MADESKIGTDWQDDELDAIIADYFAMLAADLAGEPYIKARRDPFDGPPVGSEYFRWRA